MLCHHKTCKCVQIYLKKLNERWGVRERGIFLHTDRLGHVEIPLRLACMGQGIPCSRHAGQNPVANVSRVTCPIATAALRWRHCVGLRELLLSALFSAGKKSRSRLVSSMYSMHTYSEWAHTVGGCIQTEWIFALLILVFQVAPFTCELSLYTSVASGDNHMVDTWILN